MNIKFNFGNFSKRKFSRRLGESYLMDICYNSLLATVFALPTIYLGYVRQSRRWKGFRVPLLIAPPHYTLHPWRKFVGQALGDLILDNSRTCLFNMIRNISGLRNRGQTRKGILLSSFSEGDSRGKQIIFYALLYFSKLLQVTLNMPLERKNGYSRTEFYSILPWSVSVPHLKMYSDN